MYSKRANRVNSDDSVHALKVSTGMSLLARTFMGRVRPVVGVFGASAEPSLTRRGSKNYNWYFRALEKRKTDAAVVAVYASLCL
jgi:hypothetical protein